MKVEICAGSYEGCLRAFRGGADRVELNSALSVGGLTPTLSVLRRVKAETSLKVICMIRPRAAGFCYSSDEKAVMFDDARILLENGADGLAFGFLNDQAEVEREQTEQMVRLIHSYGADAVFHRAFDVCEDPYHAMNILIQAGVDRVLTSGQRATAWDGRDLIRDLQKSYGDKIEILAASGINAVNAPELIRYTQVGQVHSSCRSYCSDPTTVRGPVTYAYLSPPHDMEYEEVSEGLVRDLVRAVHNI